MRANRKVVEARCAICDRGFELAEEVYACPFCGGYHHVQCWDANLSCAAPAPPELAPGERRCPACSKVIKQQALKCRFCGTIFDSKLAARIAPKEMPSYLAAEIEEMATNSLACALGGFVGLVCLLGRVFIPISLILGWKAISLGHKALKTLHDYPHYGARSSARGKARAGIVIGSIVLALWVIAMLAGIFG
jgi:transcription elongation factor Elf1